MPSTTGCFDFAIIGAGISGASVGRLLSENHRVIMLEAESAAGYHATGRAAAILHYGIGGHTVRALTEVSASRFVEPPADLAIASLAELRPTLYIESRQRRQQLERFAETLDRFGRSMQHVDRAQISRLAPFLTENSAHIAAGYLDRSTLKLDGNALLQGCLRSYRRRGGELLTGSILRAAQWLTDCWELQFDSGSIRARTVINAAGAWSDQIARLFGAGPQQLEALRRTVISIATPDTDSRQWPYVRTVGERFYMLGEGAQAHISPADETPSVPCDSQPEIEDVALAMEIAETMTQFQIDRPSASWSGLRSFAPDRYPTIGYAHDIDNFFWHTAFGGFGLQTCWATADVAFALIHQRPLAGELQAHDVSLEDFSPARAG